MLPSKIIEQGLPRHGSGIYDIEIDSVEQDRLRTTLFFPEESKTAQRSLLVCILHYAGQPTRFYGRPLLENVFLPVFKKYNAILVAPESIDGQWHTEKNETFVMDLLYSIKNVYKVDSRKVLIGGYSMGALGAFHFLESYPDFFSAGIALAGFPARAINPSQPVYMALSQNDEIFGYDNFVKQNKNVLDGNHKLSLSQVPASSHYDVQAFAEQFYAADSWVNQLWN